MRCHLEEDVLKLGLGQSERADVLLAHAEGCPRCSRVIQTLRRAQGVLRKDALTPSASAQQRMWRGIEKKQRGVLPLVPMFAAAAFVVLLLVWTKPAPPSHDGLFTKPTVLAGKVEEDGQILKPSIIGFGRARIEMQPGTVLEFQGNFKNVLLPLKRGQVRFSVSQLMGKESFAVRTPAAKIEALSAIFDVLAGPRKTTLSVKDGKVRVTPADQGGHQFLSAGAQVVLFTPSAKTASRAAPRSPKATGQTDPTDPAGSTAPMGSTDPMGSIEAVKNASVESRLERTPPRKLRSFGILRRSPGAEEGRAKAEKSGGPRLTSEEAQTALDQARRALSFDTERARVLAQEVLDQSPLPMVQVDALAVIADAHRRGGQLEEAARYYLQVAEHPSGRGFAEEALYRRARILAKLDRAPEALALMKSLQGRYPEGPLMPERVAFLAQLYLDAGQVGEATEVLEQPTTQRQTLNGQKQRLRVIERLIKTDPERAARLLEPLLDRPLSNQIRTRVNKLKK